MKNIIQIILAIAVFLLLIFVVKNTFFKEKNCLGDYPEVIKKYNLEGKYDTARWVLYALNATREYDFVVHYDTTVFRLLRNQEIMKEEALRKLISDKKIAKYVGCDLRLFQNNEKDFSKDSFSITLFPRNEYHDYWQSYGQSMTHTVNFENDTISGVCFGDVACMRSKLYIQEKEEEFESYLNENYDIAHCWLKQYYEKRKNLKK